MEDNDNNDNNSKSLTHPSPSQAQYPLDLMLISIQNIGLVGTRNDRRQQSTRERID